MMSSNPNASPINPLPPVVVVLALVMFWTEVAFNLGAQGLMGGPNAVGWRLAMMREFGFSGEIQDWMVQTGRYPAEHLLRYLTYPFIHASFTHMLFVVVFLLALGKMVGEIYRWWALLLVFFVPAIVGAVLYGALLDDPAPLIGGYPAVFGLIGAFTFLLWTKLGQEGANPYRAFVLIGFLLFIRLVFGLFPGNDSNTWVADIAGFATGFVLSFFVSPGGWNHVLARIRKR